jgi:hypothetical protein
VTDLNHTVGRQLISDSLGPVPKSSDEDNEAGEFDEAKEVVGVVLRAVEDMALPLDPGEKDSRST